MSNQTKNTGKIKRFLSQLTVKQILFLVVFGVVLVLTCAAIGFVEFTRSIEHIYSDEALQLNDTVSKNLNINAYEQSINVIKQSYKDNDENQRLQIREQPQYQELEKLVVELRESFDCSDIDIVFIDRSLDKTIIDYLKQDEGDDSEDAKEMEEGKLVAGFMYIYNFENEDKSVFNPGRIIYYTDDEISTVEKLYSEKSQQILVSDLENTDGSVIKILSALTPIFNDKSEVIGFINSSIKMDPIETLFYRYAILVGLLSIGIGIVFILIFIFINRRIFVNPILKIIHGTRSFVENDNKISVELEEIKTNDEIQVLAESILKLENDINNYIDNLEKITTEREHEKAELKLATNIQMSAIPHEFPAFPDRDEFDLYGIMNAARQVGGDFYNFYMIDDDHLAFLIGDVSGKGVPAALFMMFGSVLIKAQSLPNVKVNEIIEKSNDILTENNSEMLFITSWMGILEISTNTITFVNAGHEPPILVHEDGELEFVETQPNLVLGTFAGLPYKLYELKVKKGDKLFLYTDGVPEAQTEDNQFYESRRFADVIQENYNKSIKDIIKIARADIDKFVQGAEQFDDITILGLEIKGELNNGEDIEFDVE